MARYLVLSMSGKKVDMESVPKHANVNGAQHINVNAMYYTEFVKTMWVGRNRV